MRLIEIEKRARAVGIKDTWKYSKKDLIKAIQRKVVPVTIVTSLCVAGEKAV